MFKILLLALFMLVLYLLDSSFATTNENNESVNEFRYCLRKSPQSSLKECVGRTAVSFLQQFDERDNFTFADSLFVVRDDTAAASRSLVNFLDTDPVNFRGILENAGAVFSQRALEFHMDAIYPGLKFKIGPSSDSNSMAEFILDSTVNERNFNRREPSTARILTKHYVLPFLLGLKFKLVALVPIFFAIICLLLKKSLFLAKLAVYVSSILGVGGVAGSLGAFSGWSSFLSQNFGGGGGGITGHHHHAGQFADSLGGYLEKNNVNPHYDQYDSQHNLPYKRQDRNVVFDKTRDNNGDLNANAKNNRNKVRSTVEPALATAASDHFYDYEQQILLQEHNGILRQTNDKFGNAAYGSEDDKKDAGVINLSPNHRFQNSDNKGWKVLSLRV